MRIGVSSYSFSQLVHGGAMTQLDIIPKAKEMGFDVIEFAGFQLPEGETAESFAPRVRAACDEAGLPIMNYTIGADFLNPPGGDGVAGEVERLKDEVLIAEALGAPGMRHDATRGFPAGKAGAKDFATALPMLAEGCRALAEFAADHGVRTMIENHGYFCQDSERVERLISAVDHPNFGALIDMGNFLCADEDPGQAVGRLMPYAFHVHAKDFHVKPGTASDPGTGWFPTRAGNYLRGAVIGHGEVPIVQCLRVMKAAGYDGVLSIEFEGIEDPIKGIGIGLENLRRYVSQVYGT